MICAAVEFESLYVSYGQVGVVEGFDHAALDTAQTIGNACSSKLLTYPLWMYPFRRLSNPVTLCTLDYQLEAHDVEATVSLSIHTAGILHGIAIWVEYQLDAEAVESTGLQADGHMSQHYKQNVRLFPEASNVTEGSSIEAHISMQRDAAEFKFDFTAKH